MSGESPRQLDFRVAGALVGQRLDKALCGLLPDLSRAAVQRAITAGACRIDGLSVSTASLKLKAGQEVRLDLPDTANELRAEDEAVDILWQDEHLLLCNKPAGLTVHPCPSCPENTLVQRLLHHFPRLREQEGLRPGVVHRLDKDTSGLLLVALDEPTRLRMSEAFARREVHKEYLALVQGVPPQTGTCREPLGRHPTAKVKMAVVPENRGGKAAHSDWRVLWSSPRKDFSLVAVRIHTGRTQPLPISNRQELKKFTRMRWNCAGRLSKKSMGWAIRRFVLWEHRRWKSAVRLFLWTLRVKINRTFSFEITRRNLL